MSDKKTYSNPRMSHVVEDWPFGKFKTRATFTVETHPTRGQRAVRTTIDPRTGRESAPKALTYSPRVRIVDGSDGRTYVASLTASGFINIMRGDMKFQEESIFADSDPERFAQVRALFDASQ